MSRRRFYAPPTHFSATEPGGEVTLGMEESRHLRDALRLSAGDEAFVFDGQGREYRCNVLTHGASRRDFARLEVREQVEPARPESPLRLRLAVALLKGDKFETVVEKATELGVTRITPVQSARCDVRPRAAKSDAAARVARWRRHALEACKQSGRARVPQVDEPVKFESLLADEATPGRPESLRVFFTERDGRGLLEAVAGLFGATPQRVAALVGPEGGWDDVEISMARHAGWQLVTLGGRTLRAETAALASAALLQHLFGDLV
ncbi:MAG TPA: 16S rRNA (uracil(1498)-N(3))-methyltransferase [Pyrinomonadaceae bacterium]|nr:16S rRNA (uracil(1498)-N(3))-methyltransferase [Pyrinomonadaceae bacterium]